VAAVSNINVRSARRRNDKTYVSTFDSRRLMPSTRTCPTRRQLLATCGAVTLTASGGCLDGLTGTDDTDGGDGRANWPTAGYDRANTNHSPEAGAVRGVTEATRIDGWVRTQPVVVDGTVYLTGGRLRAVDVDSGEEQWTVAPEEGQGNFSWAAPTVHDDTVYVANGHQRVHAIDAATGETQWTTGIDVGSYLSPTVGRNGEALFVGGDGHVSRLDAGTGAVEWTTDLFGQVRRTLGYRASVVYAVTEGGELYALDDGDGGGYWRVDLPAKSQCSPTVGRQQVYVGTFDGFVHAVDTDRANLAWSTEVGGFAKGGIAVTDDTVYADGGRRLHAMDADSGKKQWAFDVGTTGDHAPVVTGDTVYTTGDRLYALKPDGGLTGGTVRQETIRFTHRVGGYAGPMSVADGRLFVSARGDGAEGNQTNVLLVLEAT
jgi:outer membrane protein assembly factor BamB